MAQPFYRFYFLLQEFSSIHRKEYSCLLSPASTDPGTQEAADTVDMHEAVKMHEVDRVDMVKMHEVDTVDMVKIEPGSPAPRPGSPSGSSLLGERAGHYSGHYTYASETQGEQQLQPLQPDTQPPPLVLAPAKPRTVFIRYQLQAHLNLLKKAVTTYPLSPGPPARTASPAPRTRCCPASTRRAASWCRTPAWSSGPPTPPPPPPSCSPATPPRLTQRRTPALPRTS